MDLRNSQLTEKKVSKQIIIIYYNKDNKELTRKQADFTKRILILLGVRKGLTGMGVICELYFMNRYSQITREE